MNLAILHYHLNRGGVGRVIASQLLALDAALPRGETCRAVLIHGGRREGWEEDLPGRLRAVRLALHEAPLLDYDAVHRRRGREAAEGLHAQIAGVLAHHGLAPHETVLHVHNHALGKNAALPEAVARLAGEGCAALLQIHDFAEDLRPANYRHLCQGRAPAPWKSWPEVLYPQAPHVHYAVLNGRDRAVLEAAGVDPGRLHLLPNPAAPPEDLPPRADARRRLEEKLGVQRGGRYVVYPVRCIRRKNLGEVLLLGALAPPGTVFGMTLAPLNPAERPFYDAWRRTAGALRLPCLFGTGAPGRLSFGENLAAADGVITTSVAEGFGMVFLESWLAGHPLIGRDLPEITVDYVRAGLRLDWLLARVAVPLDWIGAERFGRALLHAYRRVLEAYGRGEPADPTDALEEKTRDGLVDFGDLDEGFQRQVIEMAARSHVHRSRLFHENPALEGILSLRAEDAAGVVEANARTVAERFSLGASGRRLLEVYRGLAGSARSGPLEPLPRPEQILDRFLDLKRFRMIRG